MASAFLPSSTCTYLKARWHRAWPQAAFGTLDAVALTMETCQTRGDTV